MCKWYSRRSRNNTGSWPRKSFVGSAALSVRSVYTYKSGRWNQNERVRRVNLTEILDRTKTWTWHQTHDRHTRRDRTISDVDDACVEYGVRFRTNGEKRRSTPTWLKRVPREISDDDCSAAVSAKFRLPKNRKHCGPEAMGLGGSPQAKHFFFGGAPRWV